MNKTITKLTLIPIATKLDAYSDAWREQKRCYLRKNHHVGFVFNNFPSIRNKVSCVEPSQIVLNLPKRDSLGGFRHPWRAFRRFEHAKSLLGAFYTWNGFRPGERAPVDPSDDDLPGNDDEDLLEDSRISSVKTGTLHFKGQLDELIGSRVDEKGVVQRFAEWLQRMLGNLVVTGQVTIRLIQGTVVLSPLCVLLALERLTPISLGFEEVVWWYFFHCVDVGGPCFVKFVQWAATRVDIFPKKFCDRCAVYQNRAPQHSYDDTVNVLRESVGEDWADYLEIESEPIGSGCIAQVHRGHLKKPLRGGKISSQHPDVPLTVAVKVQHPHVVRNVSLDLLVLSKIARFVDKCRFSEWISVEHSVRQFASLMESQLNFIVEAKNIASFRETLLKPRVRRQLGRLRGRLVLPSVYYSSKSLLVESFEDGTTLKNWMSSMGCQDEIITTQEKVAVSESIVPSELKPSFLQTQSLKAVDAAVGIFCSIQGRQLHGANLGTSRNSWRKTPLRAVAFGLRRTMRATFLGFCSTMLKHKDNADGALNKILELKSVRNRIGGFGLTTFLHMLIVDNFIHADMHPGNLLIRFPKTSVVTCADSQASGCSNGVLAADGIRHEDCTIRQAVTGWCSKILSRFAAKFRLNPDFEVVLLDFGLTTSLAPRDLMNFLDLFRAVVLNNGELAGELILTRARRHDCMCPTAFYADVSDLVHEFHEQGKGETLRAGSLSSVMSRMLQLSLKHKVELAPQFVSVVLAMMVAEGVGMQIAPELDLMRLATPFFLPTRLVTPFFLSMAR